MHVPGRHCAEHPGNQGDLDLGEARQIGVHDKCDWFDGAKTVAPVVQIARIKFAARGWPTNFGADGEEGARIEVHLPVVSTAGN